MVWTLVQGYLARTMDQDLVAGPQDLGTGLV